MSTTFGSSAPSAVTVNLDALFAQSLASYRKTMTDNISESNALFHELKNSGRWDTEGGSAYIAEDLVYELAQADAYEGYDELPDTPMDGITQVLFQWRQGAVPISYSERERKQNKHRITNLVQNKIMQAEEGFKDFFNKALIQGNINNPGGTLLDPWQNTSNGAVFIDPITRFIQFDPTVSMDVGNINQSTNSWWRNRTKTCAATTPVTLFLELDNLFNTCSRGPGGKPDLAFCDQLTWELIRAAYYDKFRTQIEKEADYPFPNIMYNGVKIIWDPYVPDVYTGVASTATYGSLFFVNSKSFRMVTEEETEFEMEPFAKPLKGDSRLAHILYMGQLTCNQRRKNGVYGKIPRTLTFS